jgi:hypothetical protein
MSAYRVYTVHRPSLKRLMKDRSRAYVNEHDGRLYACNGTGLYWLPDLDPVAQAEARAATDENRRTPDFAPIIKDAQEAHAQLHATRLMYDARMASSSTMAFVLRGQNGPVMVDASLMRPMLPKGRPTPDSLEDLSFWQAKENGCVAVYQRERSSGRDKPDERLAFLGCVMPLRDGRAGVALEMRDALGLEDES